ncbi:hypothetical protein PFISCL1PPCAC_2628, partial [Pristionchus fissidentatus]
ANNRRIQSSQIWDIQTETRRTDKRSHCRQYFQQGCLVQDEDYPSQILHDDPRLLLPPAKSDEIDHTPLQGLQGKRQAEFQGSILRDH